MFYKYKFIELQYSNLISNFESNKIQSSSNEKSIFWPEFLNKRNKINIKILIGNLFVWKSFMEL